MKKFELGNQSEAIVLSGYLKAGFTVSVPFGSGASYDLLVDTGTNIFKVQVKTAWISKGVIKYKCHRRQPKGETPRLYNENEVDYIVIYCPNNDCLYGIHIKNHPNFGWLRLLPSKNGQSKRIRWAKEFDWEKHIEELKICARQESNLRPFGSEPNALSTELRAREKNYGINKINTQQI